MVRTTCGLAVLAAALLPTAVQAGVGLIDFETGVGLGSTMVNGRMLSGETLYGDFMTVSATGATAGAALFDSSPFGPNAGGADPDLLVGLGNILILQNGAFATQTVPGIFDTPNDHEHGSTAIFTLASPTSLLSLDLIDIDRGEKVLVELIDTAGKRREFHVRGGYTNDITVGGPMGWKTLNLTTTANQVGENLGVATTWTQAGFNPDVVRVMKVKFSASGGLDNIRFDAIPEPASLGLLAGAGLLGMRRRR